MNEKIELIPFQAQWKLNFEEEKQKLKTLFSGLEIDFYHIGSTSIPGCQAKPILDILGVTPDILKVDGYNEVMIQRGFKALGEYGMRQRRYFETPTIHLHVFEDSDPEVPRHLRFCEYLKRHPEKIEEYSHLKMELAKKYADSRNQYTLGKSRFIKSIDQKAALEITLSPKKDHLRKKDWTLDQIVRASEVNMHLQMTYFAKFLPMMEIVFQPDVTVVRSDIKEDTFNYVLFAKFTQSSVKKRIEEVSNLYTEKDLPFSWWVSNTDTPLNLPETLLDNGFHFKEENVGMYKSLENFKAHPFSLRFHRVHSLNDLKDFSQVLVEIGGPRDIFDFLYSQIPPVLYQEGAPLEMVVGYLNNRPIMTGTLLFHANVAGIYYVACVPKERRKGYGTQMMEYLLERAQRKGYFIATLQASFQGKHLYERLGFKACSLFKEYAKN